MDNINMTDEQYKALYKRIKKDLYDEFINPETADFGMSMVKEQQEDIYKDIVAEKDIIWNEIENLMQIMQKYEETEEYEHAAIIKKRIDKLKKRL